MGDALPPDPYLALGVAKDATATAIKAQYRKLVLKCHPDKVQDESEKQNASDKFHKIQTAYEIISDEARRARYDAQCKLAELRKDVFGGGMGGAKGGVDVRTASYKMPTDSARGGDFYARGPDRYGPRVSPQYEERRPSYAQAEYFDEEPRPTSRKYDDYDRTPKRAPPREEREKPKTSAKDVKENERSSRKEKSRRTEKDVRKERERKFAFQAEIDSESESDQYERARRKMREEDDLRRARDQYYASADKQKEEADNGYYPDERTKKMFSQGFDAKEYIERSTRVNQPRPESEIRARRPSPARKSSSKDKVEYIKRTEGKPPVMIRRGSGRPTTLGRDEAKSSKHDKERRSSLEEEPQEIKRPATLTQSKSSPADIRPPFLRQRSHTLQEEQHKEEPPMPQFRRSETMPLSPTAAAPQRESRRKESSKLRAEESYITPEPTPEPEPRKYRYGNEYADDVEYPTPDGYRTEVREPVPPPARQRFTRSPSPIRERDRPRSTSTKQSSAPQPPPMPRTTSTSYVYPDASRPAPVREHSSRGNLYGEIPTSSSPRQTYTYSPPPESVQTQREFRKEDVKFQTGYSSRRPKVSERPSYNRSGSSRHPVYVK